jgi:hypothetical protein
LTARILHATSPIDGSSDPPVARFESSLDGRSMPANPRVRDPRAPTAPYKPKRSSGTTRSCSATNWSVRVTAVARVQCSRSDRRPGLGETGLAGVWASASRAKRSPARAARSSAGAYARAGQRPDVISPAGKARAFRISRVDRLRHGRGRVREIQTRWRASGPLGCVQRGAAIGSPYNPEWEVTRCSTRRAPTR